jgi:hypothetical protein
LAVGVLLDVATVRGDDDEVCLGGIVVGEPLDQLPGISSTAAARFATDWGRRPSRLT